MHYGNFFECSCVSNIVEAIRRRDLPGFCCGRKLLAGRTILVVERQYSEAVSAACSQLSAWLRGEGAAVLSSRDPLAAPLSAHSVHLVICLGGDGTMLEVYSTRT